MPGGGGCQVGLEGRHGVRLHVAEEVDGDVQVLRRDHAQLRRGDRRRGLGEPLRERRRGDDGDEQAHGAASVAGAAPGASGCDLLQGGEPVPPFRGTSHPERQ